MGGSAVAQQGQDEAPVPAEAAAQPAPARGLSKLPPPPPADASVPAARLSDVEGPVQLLDESGKPFDQTLANMPVLPGMEIKTGGDGRAEIEFPDGAVARATPNSSLKLDKIAAGSAGNQPVALAATGGLTYLETPETPGVQAAPTMKVGPEKVTPGPGTLLRINLDGNPAQVAVLRGSAHFEGADSNVAFDLPENQTASINLDSKTDYDVAESVSPDSWDTWNADRDAVLATLASSQSSARTAEGDTADPGWNDLDYYGSWYDLPGYGMAWAPDNAGTDFDPYGSGYWGYYTTVGYSWISAYPWGWLPYRCGQWSYFNGGGGWFWLPGNCSGYRWRTYAPVRRAPVNYFLPRAPIPVHPRQHLLVAVNRAPVPAFRTFGEPRLMPRNVAIRGRDDSSETVSAAPLPIYPVLATGSHRRNYPGAGAGSGAGSGFTGGGLSTLPGVQTYAPVPPSHVSLPPPHSVLPPPVLRTPYAPVARPAMPMPMPAPVARPAMPTMPAPAPRATPAAPVARPR